MSRTMRGEMYVLRLLELSERARSHAEQLHRRSEVQGILRYLSEAKTEEVTEIFPRLASELKELFEPADLPTFAESDFDLVRRNAWAVGEALEVRSEPLEVLFDPIPIGRAYDEVARGGHRSANAEGLLILLLGAGILAAIRRKRGRSESGWGEIIRRERWLRPEAVDRLREYAAQRGWPRDAEPARILAGILHGTGGHGADDLDGGFDGLAIAAIRRRVEGLVEALREEADRQISEAREAAPDLRTLTLLHGWIDMYEMHAIARGLLNLCGGTATVGAMLAAADVNEITVASSNTKKSSDAEPKRESEPEPEPGEYLIIEAGEPYPRRTGFRFRRHLCVTFSVLCEFRDRSAPQAILQVVGLPVEEYHRLRRGLLALRGQDLSPVGATLSKRLLNTEVASCMRLDGLLRACVEDHVDLIAQTIVLAKMRKPVDTLVPWSKHLSDTLRVALNAGDQAVDDIVLTADVRQIVEDLESSYRSEGRQIVVESWV